MSKLRMINADAQVSITMGTPFIQRLQQAMLHLANGLSEEQLTLMQTSMENKVTEFDDPAVQHTVTLVMLLLDIENKVVTQNMYTDTEYDESADVTPPEN